MNMTVRKRGVLELNSACEQNKLDLQSYQAMKYVNGVTTIKYKQRQKNKKIIISCPN